MAWAAPSMVWDGTPRGIACSAACIGVIDTANIGPVASLLCPVFNREDRQAQITKRRRKND
ncbi:hypothetical protein CBM2606_A30377 [Cupriavidus taiwanensis]|nr:hypothetical protein CBM2606_A30377 [Cupriavidus taiwanensis]